MSGADHGHGSDHDQGVTDIIPLGSWQDNLLALICLCVLAGFAWWGSGFAPGAIKVAVHEGAHEHGAESQSSEHEHEAKSSGAAEAEHGAEADQGTEAEQGKSEAKQGVESDAVKEPASAEAEAGQSKAPAAGEVHGQGASTPESDAGH